MVVNSNKASRCFSLVTPITSLLRICLMFLLLVGVSQAQRYAVAVGSGVQLTRSEQNNQYDFQVMKFLPTA